MNFLKTAIDGVWIIEPRVFADARGYFMESFRQDLFEQHVGKLSFVQDNESKSVRGVLRGLHYQLPPCAQSKLVRAISGAVLDVAVDIRAGSPTFGQHVAVTLSADNKRQLFIPHGFAHGFLVLSDEAVFSYKVDNPYSPTCERGIRFDDPDVGIAWGMEAGLLLLSEKDRSAPTLREAEVFKS
ncbi:MAG: dTDP-4-dehydrorhamnose 3,5-epimerase [Prevotellaceae bacterium]|jgi:dTDP-4-dehydrorhamnose 3,5-epimerase|nr:dTDP-4-dehydrorhamnose 3,5-epimerase [Prevotellaceae bacterium]